MKKYLKLLRVKHWIKNILIFIPILFSKSLSYSNLVANGLGFLAFSFMASFIYIVNDIRDIEKDKMHPTKRKRPLASGEISRKSAIGISIVLLVLSLVLNFFTNLKFINDALLFLLAYMMVNIAYSFKLKNVAILDVALLASGFVIRVYYGAALSSVGVSNWLFLTMVSASFFFGLGKRKKEYQTSKNSRKVLLQYNKDFLDKFQYVTLSLTLVFYSLWAIEQEAKYFYFTIPLVIIIFMRYSLIIEGYDEGDPTTVLYNDKTLLALATIYGISMLLLLEVF